MLVHQLFRRSSLRIAYNSHHHLQSRQDNSPLPIPGAYINLPSHNLNHPTRAPLTASNPSLTPSTTSWFLNFPYRKSLSPPTVFLIPANSASASSSRRTSSASISSVAVSRVGRMVRRVWWWGLGRGEGLVVDSWVGVSIDLQRNRRW